MIKTVTIIIVIIIINIILAPVHAAESTPSATIQQKLEELKTSIASKAAKLKQEISKKLDNRYFTGALISKTPTLLTLQTKNIIINQDTVYEELGKTKTKFSYKTLVKDNYIAALGEIDDQGLLHARKVVLLPKTVDGRQKAIIYGQVVSEEEKILVLKTKDKKIVPVYKNKINTPYKLGDTLIMTGYLDKDDILEASFSASVKSLTVSMPLQ